MKIGVGCKGSQPLTLVLWGCPHFGSGFVPHSRPYDAGLSLRPCRDLPSSRGAAGPPGKVAVGQQSVTMRSRPGRALSQTSPSTSPQLLGALPGQAQGTSAARQRGGRRSLPCQDVCPRCPGKLCQTFPLVLSQRRLRQLNPPARPRRAWNRRTV